MPQPVLCQTRKGHLTWKCNQTEPAIIPLQPLQLRRADSVTDIFIFIADGRKKTSLVHKHMHPVEILFLQPYTTSSQQTNKQRLYSITHYYSRISVNIWCWSQRSRSPAGWPCPRHTKRQGGWGWAGSCRRSRYRWRPACHRLVMSPGGQGAEAGSEDLPPRGQGVLCKGQRSRREMLSTPPSAGPGLAYLSHWLGAAHPAVLRGGCCFHFWAAITRSSCCWLPTHSATAGTVQGSPHHTRRSFSPGREGPGHRSGWDGLRAPPLPLSTASTWAPTRWALTQLQEGFPSRSSVQKCSSEQPHVPAGCGFPCLCLTQAAALCCSEKSAPLIWLQWRCLKALSFSLLAVGKLNDNKTFAWGFSAPSFWAQWNLHFVHQPQPPRNAVIFWGTPAPMSNCSAGSFWKCQAPQWTCFSKLSFLRNTEPSTT